ncbi:hypothetical protein [Jannaschia aquimarina]|uniref:Protein ImuA n=1 Tax=Jannaschia aquimarina TaxID=935700 RepID=A0A0D1DBB6_9RHOB|nr:hypothetical protein [Jannaschia aquimarina]KIT17243.1 hypothetical protein jaqu_09740 [Jannaschia aquimarina]SNT19006.1 protein ImuA [Jannaschia aquimarina]
MTQILSFPDVSGQGGCVLPPDPPERMRSEVPSESVSSATLLEAWTGPRDAAGPAFALAALRGPGPVLWVQDRLSAREAGRPQARTLRRLYGRDVILVRPARVPDLLMAMEMALSCPALSGVLGEVWGDPPRLDFTATKRLALRAEQSGVPCWLIRRGADPALSAARARWRVTSLPSAPPDWDTQSPGAPRWRAELFRSRADRPGLWVAGHDGPQDRLRFAAVAGDGAMVDPAGAQGRRATR